MFRRYFSGKQKRLKQNKMLLQMVFSYFLVSTLLITILSLFLGYRFTKKSEQDYIASYTEIISRIGDSVNLIFSDTYKSAQDLMKHDEVLHDAVYKESFTADEIMAIRGRMVDFLTANPFVYSIYLVNGAADTIFTSYPYQCRKDEFYDQEALFLLAEQKSQTLRSRNDEIKVEGSEVPSDYITLLYPIPGKKDAYESGMVINISCKMLRSYLESAYTENTDLFIVDAMHTVIFASGQEELLSKPFDGQLMGRIADGGDGNYFSFSWEGEDCQVIYQKGDAFGLTYFGIIPQRQIQENSRFLIRFMMILTLLLILTGVFVAYSYILKIYVPVYTLVEKVKDKEDRENAGEDSEFEYLDRMYESLFRNIGELAGRMEQYCLYRVLNGEYGSREQMLEDMKTCELSFPHEQFFVYCLKFSHYSELNASYGADGFLQFKTELMRRCQKIFGGQTAVSAVAMGMDSVALVLNEDVFSEERQRECTRILRDFIRFVRHKYGIWIQAGAGLLALSVKDLHESCSQAVFAVSCEMYQSFEETQEQEILDYKAVSGRRDCIVAYPAELERKILSAVKAMDETAAKESFAQLLFQFCEGSPEIAQLYILKFCIPLVELFAAEGKADVDFSHIRKELELRETLYEKQGYLTQLFDEFIEWKQEQKRKKEASVAEAAAEWIRQNYADANLTLEAIAKAQGISSSYLRKVFKETKEISPTDYLMEYRLEQAKELLLSTEDTSIKICEKIGISNTKYFYSVFKKATGYTTSEYKKQFKKEAKGDGADR